MTADLPQAETVVNEYFKMLEAGSTSGILDLLTGPMLKRNKNLLEKNSKYAALLSDRYRNSSVLITKYQAINSSKIKVDVLITLSTQEKVKTRFILSIEGDRLKIYGEETVP